MSKPDRLISVFVEKKVTQKNDTFKLGRKNPVYLTNNEKKFERQRFCK